MKRRKLFQPMTGLALIMLLLAACGTTESAPTPDPVLEENKTIARRFNDEIWNEANLDVADEIVAADLVWHDAGVNGVAAFKQHLTTFRTNIPDVQIVTEYLIAEGDKVAVRATFEGTFAPTGKHATWTGIAILRIADGRIVEIWTNEDSLGLLQQAGFELTPP